MKYETAERIVVAFLAHLIVFGVVGALVGLGMFIGLNMK